MLKQNIRIGAHVSTAGGMVRAVERAKAIGAETIQIFGASPRQWRTPLPGPEIGRLFRETAEREGIGPVFLHAPYLINLASPPSELRQRSILLLGIHLKIAEQAGARGVIFHLGSSASGGEKAEKAVAAGILEIFKTVPGEAQLILENSAGGRGGIGATLEELDRIMELAHGKRVGVCLDTAHSFESGLLPEFSEESLSEFAKQAQLFLGDRLRALHVNDSKTAANSRLDRHENIGAGKIGKEGFARLMRKEFFQKVPWILEVPGADGKGPDKRNVDILRELREGL